MLSYFYYLHIPEYSKVVIFIILFNKWNSTILRSWATLLLQESWGQCVSVLRIMIWEYVLNW